jgi:hypothetical protein
VEREAEGKAKRNNSLVLSVELTETLPMVPQGRRVARKRKAHVVESSRYEVAALLNCPKLELLHANTVFFAVHLLLLLTSSAKSWSRPDLPGMTFQQMKPQKLLGRTRRLLPQE